MRKFSIALYFFVVGACSIQLLYESSSGRILDVIVMLTFVIIGLVFGILALTNET